MRFHILALGVLLAVGCADRTDADDAATPPAADTGTDAPADMPPEPAPEPEPTTTVPGKFQGTYAADAAACDADGHESHLMIGASSIEFHESSGTVTAVESSGNDLEVTADLTGEGETRSATYMFMLSEDGQTLTDNGSGMTRVRCG
jgi:hypothetical protein